MDSRRLKMQQDSFSPVMDTFRDPRFISAAVTLSQTNEGGEKK